MNNSVVKVDPIQRVEILLRSIISEVLSTKIGPSWIKDHEHGLGEERVEELTKLQKEEEGRRYTLVVDQDLLSYTEFRDLREILEKKENEKFFRRIFKDWDAFKVYLKKIEYLRNPAKHHRFINEYEMSLLQGIVGEIEENINAWHIGTRYQIKKYRFNFFEYVLTKDKAENQILALSKEKGKGWIEQINRFFHSKGIDKSKIILHEEEFTGSISAGQIKAQWYTSPTFHPNTSIDGIESKSVELKLGYSLSSRLELDELIEFINKKYFMFTFELDGKIDINRLMDIAKNIAGLSPSSAARTGKDNNILYGSVEYSIMQSFRIGIRNIDQRTSEIYIQSDIDGFRWAHKAISLGTLYSYLTGNISPRVMISLIKSSL